MGWLLSTHKFFTGSDLSATPAVTHPAFSNYNRPRSPKFPLYQVVCGKFMPVLAVSLRGVGRHMVRTTQGIFPRGNGLEVHGVDTHRPTAQVVTVERVWQIRIHKQLVHNTTAYFIKASLTFSSWAKVARSYVDIGISRFGSASSPIPTGGAVI